MRFEMFYGFEEAAGAEAEQPARAKLLDFIACEFDLAATHEIGFENKIVVAELIEHIHDALLVGAAGVGEEGENVANAGLGEDYFDGIRFELRQAWADLAVADQHGGRRGQAADVPTGGYERAEKIGVIVVLVLTEIADGLFQRQIGGRK